MHVGSIQQRFLMFRCSSMLEIRIHYQGTYLPKPYLLHCFSVPTSCAYVLRESLNPRKGPNSCPSCSIVVLGNQPSRISFSPPIISSRSFQDLGIRGTRIRAFGNQSLFEGFTACRALRISRSFWECGFAPRSPFGFGFVAEVPPVTPAGGIAFRLQAVTPFSGFRIWGTFRPQITSQTKKKWQCTE